MNPNPHWTCGRALLAVTAVAVSMAWLTPAARAQELVLGEEHIYPGIVLIFEAAVRDKVLPESQHLAEDLTDIHIEARANWHADESEIPPGTPPGGFVAYLNLNAEITNQVTGKKKFVTLLPHINLIDSLHYARNMQLPGEPTDLYKVKIYLDPPDPFSLSLHRDWAYGWGKQLTNSRVFTYDDVQFVDIVTAPPRPSSLLPDPEAAAQ